jgi:hypothetical protein
VLTKTITRVIYENKHRNFSAHRNLSVDG